MAIKQSNNIQQNSATNTISIEISSEFIECCSSFGVTPGLVLNEFIKNTTYPIMSCRPTNAREQVAAEGWTLAFDYLNRFYGSMRSKAKRSLEKQLHY